MFSKILLLSIGRSGTTHLMTSLNSHNQISTYAVDINSQERYLDFTNKEHGNNILIGKCNDWQCDVPLSNNAHEHGFGFINLQRRDFGKIVMSRIFAKYCTTGKGLYKNDSIAETKTIPITPELESFIYTFYYGATQAYSYINFIKDNHPNIIYTTTYRNICDNNYSGLLNFLNISQDKLNGGLHILRDKYDYRSKIINYQEIYEYIRSLYQKDYLEMVRYKS